VSNARLVLWVIVALILVSFVLIVLASTHF
jgi:TRAP-type mannitol/chloroaromatic compound transport system permease small subunit